VSAQAKKLIQTLQLPKSFSQFQTDSIEPEKCMFMVDLVKDTSAHKVANVSKAVSVITEWLLGIVEYRRI
jgi:hypothetical protein